VPETNDERIAREVVETEAASATIRSRSPEYLVGYLIGRPPQDQNIALAELQRRLIIETATFSATSTAQAREVIRLTSSLRQLTWLLFALGIVQVVAPFVWAFFRG
jgi:hypothetical protein